MLPLVRASCALQYQLAPRRDARVEQAAADGLPVLAQDPVELTINEDAVNRKILVAEIQRVSAPAGLVCSGSNWTCGATTEAPGTGRHLEPILYPWSSSRHCLFQLTTYHSYFTKLEKGGKTGKKALDRETVKREETMRRLKQHLLMCGFGTGDWYPLFPKRKLLFYKLGPCGAEVWWVCPSRRGAF